MPTTAHSKQAESINEVKHLPSAQSAEFQRNTSLLPPQLMVGDDNDALEIEADQMADKALNVSPQIFLQRKENGSSSTHISDKTPANAALSQGKTNETIPFSSGGNPMDNPTKSFMESRFGANFSQVKLHTNQVAAQMSQSLHAKAFTTGNDIFFNQNEFNTDTHEGKHLLAHELAHVLQQKQGGASRKIQRQALPTDLSAYPEAERRRIQISWTAISGGAAGTLPPLNDLFGTTPATAGGLAVTRNAPRGALVFSSNVPASPSTPATAPPPGSASTIYGFDVRHGLSNLAHFLEDPARNIMTLNSTITLTLNLTPFGGSQANYRFSCFEHNTSTHAAPQMQVITLIEQLGASSTLPIVANPTNAAPSGAFSAGSQSFTLTANWTLQQKAILDQALALVPPNGMSQLSGATFDIGSRSTSEEGHYNEETHTITIRTTAFNDRINAYQGGGDAVRIILHEIAHAIDRRSVRLAWATYDAGGQTSAGRRALERTKSLSGSSYVFDATQNAHVLSEGAATTAFRTAVIADRTLSGATLLGGITTYSITNWEENFGEAFGMYMAERTLFQQLRPATYRYFATNYP